MIRRESDQGQALVPLFLEQIAQGGRVAVTHADATRFFMTILAAAQLILQAAAMGQRPALEGSGLVLYRRVVGKVVPVSSPRVAEAAKLLENIYRAVNIALVNELKLCFDRMEMDVWEVIEAAVPLVVVGANGAIEPVPGAEIEAVRALVNGPLRYDPCPFLAEGMEVEVVRGPLMGVRGRLIRKDRTARLVIAITLIHRGASLETDAADVAPV